MTSLDHAQTLSPVIRSLRLTTDEVQFGRVLAALCQDSAVAEAFTSAVIDRAKGGNAATRRRVRVNTCEIRCVEEQRLEARVSRRSLRRRAKDLGRVDLDFAGSDGWELVVELKLDAGFGDGQVDRYTMERPVAVVVRDPADLPTRKAQRGWVGAATWQSLREDLRALPVDPRWRQEWLGLLDVMDRDGDFKSKRPDGVPEVVAARSLFESIAPDVLERFRSDLDRVYGTDAAVAIRRLSLTKPYGKQGPWAGFGLSTRGDGAWMFFELRNLWSPAPRLRVWHWHFDDWRSRKSAREAYATLEDKRGFRQLRDGAVFEQPTPALAKADGPALVEAIGQRIAGLVESRAFDPDVRYQRKQYS